MHLVFADTSWGVAHARTILQRSRADTQLVVLSAEALEAANALGLDSRAVGAIVAGWRKVIASQEAGLQAWYSAVCELEAMLAAAIPACRFDGPGILSSRFYLIAFAVNAVRHRAGLQTEAMKALSAQRVTIVETYRDPLFIGDGYDFNPWTLAARDWAQARSIETQVVFAEPPRASTSLRSRALLWARKQTFLRRLKKAFGASRADKAAARRSADLAEMRILFSDTTGYDWTDVYEHLNDNGAELSLIEGDPQAPRLADASYLPRIDNSARGMLDLQVPADAEEIHASRIEETFDQWARQTPWRNGLTLDDVDTFGVLQKHIRSLATSGPALLRHADAVIRAALDRVAPHAVCFFCIAYPFQKRLAFECNRRGIPVVCYQHGGAYGTHEVPVHDFIENSHADFFLAYGSRVEPPSSPLVPTRARYVAVGSARVEALRLRGRPRRPDSAQSQGRLNVVVAGDLSYRNTLIGGTEIEDTVRYTLETRLLATLSQSDSVRVIYRPFPGDLQAQGTPAWIARARPAGIEVDTSSKIAALLSRTDLLVTTSTSGTLWNEALALGIALVAYIDPLYTVTRGRYRDDLATACIVCGNAAELEAVTAQMATEGKSFLDRFAAKEPSHFLRDYVLADDACASAATRFLVDLWTGRQDESEAVGDSARQPLGDAAPGASRSSG
jgi:hypothetical protein